MARSIRLRTSLSSFPATGVEGRPAFTGGSVMSDIQSVNNDSKANNNNGVVVTPESLAEAKEAFATKEPSPEPAPVAASTVTVNETSAGAQDSSAKEQSVVTGALPSFESLRTLGIQWADAGLGHGRSALEAAARALNDAAQKLGELQEQLRKSAAAPAPSAG